MNKLSDRATEIRQAITERFITEGKDSTVKEIAEWLGCSEPTVRKALDSGIEGVDWFNEHRTSYSKHYRMFEAGAHRVRTYGPSREHLACLIKQLRGNT